MTAGKGWAEQAKLVFHASNPYPDPCVHGILRLLHERHNNFEDHMQAAWESNCRLRFAGELESGCRLAVGNWRERAFNLRHPASPTVH